MDKNTNASSIFTTAEKLSENVSSKIFGFQSSFSDEPMFITIPQKKLLKSLLSIWFSSFILFCLSIGALAYLLIFVWIYMAVALFLFSKIWHKFGYSYIALFVMTAIVFMSEYFISFEIRSLIYILLEDIK